MKQTSITLAPVAPLAPIVGGGTLVAFNVGPDRLVYLVVALKPLDSRIVAASGASFAKPIADEAQSYRVVALLDGAAVLDVAIEGERFNVHDVQPLPRDELLLVCGRTRGGADLNGRVCRVDGTFRRGIHLGDGIERVQATADGTIWTSYFDEGVFGDSIGASGLVAFDPAGRVIHRFEPTGDLDSICDCYALNVAGDDVWIDYYTEFPLVRLRAGTVDAVWRPSVKGSDAFAIGRDCALLRGGYDARDTYNLIALWPDGRAESIATFELRGPEGKRLKAERAVGRGDSIWLVASGAIWRVDVRAALAARKGT